jgi:hypothetical protein
MIDPGGKTRSQQSLQVLLNQDESENKEHTDDKQKLRRTIVYSPDVKDSISDEDHETIENIPYICKLIQETLFYLHSFEL